MDTARSGMFSISSARLTAYAAVLVLCGIVGWNTLAKPAPTAAIFQESTSSDETSADPLALLGQDNTYGADDATSSGITPLGASIFTQAVLAYDKASQAASSSGAGLAAVQEFGASISPQIDYRTYASSDITTTSDTSKDRVLAYRADLRTALEPLLENKDYELDLFASYVDTKDAKYLDALRAASANYKLAITNTEKVVAPTDAAVYQAAILTAMSEFSASLDAMAENATDPFASAALLKSYTGAQDSMLASFNSVAQYSAGKML